MMINVSLNTANIHAINISTPVFRIWQHFNSNWTTPHLQKLTNVPEVPVAQLYKHMILTSEPVHLFTFNKDDDKDQSLIWTILTHPGMYIKTIGMLFTACIGIYCFERLWLRPANPQAVTLLASLIMTCHSG